MNEKSERVLITVCLIVFAVLIGMSGVQTYKTIKDGEIISVTMSDDAINVVKEDAPERLFNDYNLGEALIFNEIPVFFDARADLYAHDNIMADGVSMTFFGTGEFCCRDIICGCGWAN